MKDAVGSTMLVYIVIIVVGIVGAILIASNMYTSAYKVKNNIVKVIDRYYMVNKNTNCFGDSGSCVTDIKNVLKGIGYHVSNANCTTNSNDKIYKKVLKKGKGDVSLVHNADGYCIYRTDLNMDEYYYTVVTFSHLNINAFGIGSLFSTPVYGETRTYYNG